MTPDARERILDAAADLLVSAGQEGVSTRAVAAAAGVQAPTLYRLFGDKQGLIDAVVAHGFERYLAEKHALVATDDILADLRRGWDNHVEFGLSHPAFYTLMFANVRPGQQTTASGEAFRVLLATLQRAARAGVLVVPIETAAHMVHAAGVGVTLFLIGEPDGLDRAELSHRVRDALFAAIFAVPASGRPVRDATLANRAIALTAALDAMPTNDKAAPPPLTPPELALLHQWLTRLAAP